MFPKDEALVNLFKYSKEKPNLTSLSVSIIHLESRFSDSFVSKDIPPETVLLFTKKLI